jgi:4'-phosphopantetheinyl transferase
MAEHLWRRPLKHPALKTDEVHVWRSALSHPDAFALLEETLTDDEHTRAQRFHFARDREEFIVGRGVLRMLLAGYTRRAPRTIHFRYGLRGKPELAIKSNGHALRFNVSHSHGLALFAFTFVRAVGVDIEQVNPSIEIESLASRFFSAAERARLQTLPPEMRLQAFFNCWTRKEAFIKARGEGLSLPLDQFAVTLAPDEPAAILSTAWDVSDAARWRVEALAPREGYIGAVAAEGHDWTLACWDWAAPR